ncbi:phage tail protein, partial [Serratia ureilytica]|nr:phage tail protein [Serratia ureilytica]
QNKNPNTLFPGTTWKYIGENRTIRLGKQDGSDLMQTGGADSVTLNNDNLPAHNHSFAADTSWFDYGSKWTSQEGLHSHNAGINFGTPAVAADSGVASAISADRFTTTDGLHSHKIDIGGHSHSVSGTTGATGGGMGFSVVNQYIKLMGWYRSA